MQSFERLNNLRLQSQDAARACHNLSNVSYNRSNMGEAKFFT